MPHPRQKFIDAAIAQKWRVERLPSGHHKLYPVNKEFPVVVIGGLHRGGDARAIDNERARLKRYGLKLDGLAALGGVVDTVKNWPTWAKVAGAVVAWETFWWTRRYFKRISAFKFAQARAKQLGKPLVVVGAPDMGPTPGPGCGDITIDMGESKCPNFIKADITKKIPLESDSAVVLVLAVLEYVDDYDGAIRELNRVAGKELYIVRVEPWTLTSRLHWSSDWTTKRVLPVYK